MRILPLGVLSLGVALSSCIVVAADDTTPAPRSDYTGALIVDWTVDGSTNADECDQGDAVWLRLSVFTSSGRPVADFADDCAAFSTSVELDPGSYYAEAILEDADGNQRTTAVQIDDFTILGRDSISVPIDFPSSSFY
jgi:hypothetical protein